MQKTAGQLVYETLRSYGMDAIFGMKDPVYITSCIDPEKVKVVTIRDEKHGAIMAHAYAQVTGRAGVCTAMLGPGASNLVTGLLEAQLSSVPVIALVGDLPLEQRNRNATSEIDHEHVLGPVVKRVLRIDTPSQAADIVRKAFRIAHSGRPGPVVVLCPIDVLRANAEGDVTAEPDYLTCPALRARPAAGAVARAATLLERATRPVIVAGGGVFISNAAAEVIELAERFQVPVVTTMNGRGVIPDEHPLSAGPIGKLVAGKYGRGRIGNEVLANADVVLLLGTRTGQTAFNDWTTPSATARIIHVDADPEELGRNFRAEVPIIADVREALRDILRHCAEGNLHRLAQGSDELAGMKRQWRELISKHSESASRPIRPERVVRELAKGCPKETLFVADASYATSWVQSHLDVKVGGRFSLSPRGTGGLGWCLPAAIAAKLADPGRPVVCLAGDGGFGYVMNELETAARCKAQMLIVILNNASLGFQKHHEEKVFGFANECDFLDIDFAGVAKSMGCDGERVSDPEALAMAIMRGLDSGRPYLLDVVVDARIAGPVLGLDDDTAPAPASH